MFFILVIYTIITRICQYLSSGRGPISYDTGRFSKPQINRKQDVDLARPLFVATLAQILSITKSW